MTSTIDRAQVRALARGLPGPMGPPPMPVWNGFSLGFVDVNGNPIGATKSLLGPEGPAGDSQTFLTRPHAIASAITPLLVLIRIMTFDNGYPVEPAYYKPGTSNGPMAFQEANGNWWQLDISSSLHFASWYGVNGDAGEYSAALQKAVTAAQGIEVRLPVGIVGLANQVNYITTVDSAPSLRLSGAGTGLTIIDNRCTSGNGCIYAAGTTGTFPVYGFIKNIFFKTTTGSAVPAFDLKAVYRFTVEDVWVKGMAGNGSTISNTIGDADASNIVLFKRCFWLGNGGAGLLHNFASTITQTSFVRCEDCFFQSNGLCGWYFIGAQGSMYNCGFTENGSGAGGQGALWIANNAGSSDQFYAGLCSFENNYVQSVRIDALQGGTFLNCEIAGGGIPSIVATIGFNINGSSNVRIEGTRVRIGSATPYTAFQFGAGAFCNVVSNTFWQNWNDATQVRFARDPAAYGNRLDDSFDAIQIGSQNGVASIACVNGANENLALRPDGAMYSIGTGVTGAFSLGGLTNGFPGRRLILQNNSGQTMTLEAESGSSTAANRINTEGNANVTVSNAGCCTLFYGADNRWHYLGKG